MNPLSQNVWKLPPRIKVFEALGAVADGRVTLSDTGAIVLSSDGSKTYTVKYHEGRNMISANDNGSRWQGYMGYPAIALLMKLGKLSYDGTVAESLKAIPWKKINTEYKNDWKKVEEFLFQTRDREKLETFANAVLAEIQQRSFYKFQKLQ